MPLPKPKLVFIAPKITQSFMTHDMALIKPFVDIIPLDLSKCGGYRRYTYFTKLLRLLIREHPQIVLCYFVVRRYTWLTAILVKLLRRKFIIVTGGFDAAYVPDINWGALGTWRHRRFFSIVMRLSDSVLPFSNSSRDELLRHGKPKRIRTAYMAIDAETFKPGTQPKAPRAVTVCYSISQVKLLQKGIRPFVQAAALVPDIEFIVVGQFKGDTFDYLKKMATPNVHFTRRYLDQSEYIEMLQSAAVYVQASAHEGFGVALAEGMACGCVPVVADRYSLPEVVGNTGYVVPFNDPAAIAQAVREAIAHPEKGEAARRRVVENFTETQRQKLLHEELEFVMGRKL